MSNINGLGNAQQIARTQAAKPAGATAPAAASSAPARGDKVEVNSTAAAMLAKLKGAGDVRLDKVSSIKSQIEAGTYDADSKFNDDTLNKLLDDLA